MSSNNYVDKYLKYKNKYLHLKNHIGGTYNNLIYLGEGAESMAFRMDDGKVLKIIKNYNNRISDLEKDIMNKLSDLNTINFPKFYSIGTCKSLVEVNANLTSFCIDDNVNEPNANTYQYIIMDEIQGKDMINIFYGLFKDNLSNEIDINDNEIKNKLNNYAKIFLNSLIKITSSLKLANDRYGFRHNDFDFRNCYIDNNNNPVIFDFGSSTINNNNVLECKDIMGFINSTLNESYYIKHSNVTKYYPNSLDDNQFMTKIINNCKKLITELKKNDIIKKIKNVNDSCQPYFNVDINFDVLINKFNEIFISQQ